LTTTGSPASFSWLWLSGRHFSAGLLGLPHLTPAQIYEALSDYHDHQAEIERDIEESRVERLIERYGLEVTADGRIVAQEDRES